MKIKTLALSLGMILGLSITGCAQSVTPTPSSIATISAAATVISTSQETQETPTSSELTLPAIGDLTPDNRHVENTPAKTETYVGKDDLISITLSVGNSSFSAKLYDNETTRTLLAKFPQELNMVELYGREKYFYLPEKLPFTYAETPETIYAGEIMLWSSNCLVVFYNTFPNTVSGYVKLGYVEDVAGLTEALGGGNVQVAFTVSN